MARRVSGKFWVFTENADPDQFRINIEDLYQSKNDHIQYICGQLEQASHRHFQGYLQLKVSRALSWVKNNVSATAHWEVQRGSTEQAREYCHKEDATTIEGTFVECGEYIKAGKGAGKRNDLIALATAVKEGKTQREIIEDLDLLPTFARHIRFHDRIRTLYPPSRPENYQHKVILLFGDTGTGKTKKALTDYPNIYRMPLQTGSTMWLDGYDGHKEALLDDFAGKMSKLSCVNTLQLLDRNVVPVPIKGGFVNWNPETIVITTNYHPRCWYNWATREKSWAPLKRRFTEIWIFETGKEPYEAVPEAFLEDKEYWPRNEEHFHT